MKCILLVLSLSYLLDISMAFIFNFKIHSFNKNGYFGNLRRNKFATVARRNVSIQNFISDQSSLDNSDYRRKRSSFDIITKTYSSTKFFEIVIKCLFFMSFCFRRVIASVSAATTAVDSNLTPIQGVSLWGSLFFLSAALHSAESAITKISPWKVQQFIDEEGPKSPFATLLNNMTSLLSTILVVTTACSIYSTGLFFATASQLIPNANLGVLTALLTIVTLFLGELLPKALAVSNSELVARKMVPIINRLSQLLSPITSLMTTLSNFILKIAGMRQKEETNVTENMLRLVVSEAERSEGIKTDESRMIKAVLDMEDTECSRIMQPRVDIVGLPETASATKILETALSTRYSRIPVYKDDIDNIVGVIYCKDLLNYMSPPNIQSQKEKDGGIQFPTWPKESPVTNWNNLNAAQLMQPTFYIPESMKAWDALQEMKKRRSHMAIVVDEYGGTSGLVTFEDILEEVVGEIYDEDDSDEQLGDSENIFKVSRDYN